MATIKELHFENLPFAQDTDKLEAEPGFEEFGFRTVDLEDVQPVVDKKRTELDELLKKAIIRVDPTTAEIFLADEGLAPIK